MAALHSRKLLPAEDQPVAGDKRPESCYMCYVCPDDCYLQTPPPSPPPPPSLTNHHIPTVLILMLCVLGGAFLVLSYLTVRRYRNCRRRNSPPSSTANADSPAEDYFLDEDHGPAATADHHIWYIRTSGLSRSLIDSISVFDYKKGGGLIECVDCSVCLNEFQENETLRLLPKCSHAFHVPCIDTWLTSHKNCPVCRAPVSTNNNNNDNNVRLSGFIETNVVSSVEENDNRNNNHPTMARNEPVVREEITIENNRGENILRESRIGKFRVVSDLAGFRVKVDNQESEPVRRSLSLDFSSASIVYRDVISVRDEGCSMNNNNNTNTKLENFGKRNSSVCTKIKKDSLLSIQKGSVSMKRSFSFSGKRSSSKNSRSQESITIRELAMYTKSQSINL
ncbi:hypothetical protein ABFS82_12G015700 [Erythranthe guttata]|nr:PREDICTED: E3 ubiquitin-protein ligase RING1-like [Erythranthe guttata]|eukprot:XP_012840819.1 PREDICTED: E3 ubiquitin-protein ligase RING1-like [Erythranthe guttata]